MLQKFGKRVMNNFGLKILAVLFAVVLWIVVVNMMRKQGLTVCRLS